MTLIFYIIWAPVNRAALFSQFAAIVKRLSTSPSNAAMISSGVCEWLFACVDIWMAGGWVSGQARAVGAVVLRNSSPLDTWPHLHRTVRPTEAPSLVAGRGQHGPPLHPLHPALWSNRTGLGDCFFLKPSVCLRCNPKPILSNQNTAHREGSS